MSTEQLVLREPRRVDVVVVGASPAGLLLAIELRGAELAGATP